MRRIDRSAGKKTIQTQKPMPDMELSSVALTFPPEFRRNVLKSSPLNRSTTSRTIHVNGAMKSPVSSRRATTRAPVIRRLPAGHSIRWYP